MSGQRDIRLLLVDVDGILVTQDDVLTEAAKAAARVLNHAGIIFTITRGRPPRGMSMLVEPLALQRAVAGFDGGVFVNPDLSVIDSHKIDPATTKQSVKLIVDRGLDVWVYMDEEWLSLIRPRHMWRTRRGVKFDAKCGVLHGRLLGGHGEVRWALRRSGSGRRLREGDAEHPG